MKTTRKAKKPKRPIEKTSFGLLDLNSLDWENQSNTSTNDLFAKALDQCEIKVGLGEA